MPVPVPVPVPVQVWCSKFRPEEARNRLLTDVHRCEDRQIQRAREQDTHTCTHTHTCTCTCTCTCTRSSAHSSTRTRCASPPLNAAARPSIASLARSQIHRSFTTPLSAKLRSETCVACGRLQPTNTKSHHEQTDKHNRQLDSRRAKQADWKTKALACPASILVLVLCLFFFFVCFFVRQKK